MGIIARKIGKTWPANTFYKLVKPRVDKWISSHYQICQKQNIGIAIKRSQTAHAHDRASNYNGLSKCRSNRHDIFIKVIFVFVKEIFS